MRTLLTSLTEHPMAMLRGIAELNGVALTTNARDEAAAQLAAALAEPGATDAALATCSEAGRAAWATLRIAGGRMKTPIFTRGHGALRPVGPARLEREAVWLRPENGAEDLWYRGLIFRGFADLGDGPSEYIYIPFDLLPATDSTPAEAAPTALSTATEPERRLRAFNSLAVDLCALLAAIREAPVRVDAAGRVRPADLARLREGLLIPDPTRIELALALARSRGWLAVDRDRLALNSQAATGWLRATPWEQMTALFDTWRESTDAGSASGWNDLRRIPALQAEGTWRNDPLAARRAILDMLRQLKPGSWHSVDDLIGWIKATNPDFQRPDGSYTGWYLKDVETERYLSGFETWDAVEGRLIRFVVTGPLFWLGAVALGAAEAAEGQLQSFRLTQLGAAWIGGRPPAELPRPARLAVDDQFAISAPLLLPLLDRFRLLRFTEPAADPVELGQPTQHRITRGGLARARAAGVRAEAIVEFLQRASGGHVPPRVSAALARWDQHGGAVRITRGAVLRVEDASILAALRADTAVAPLLGDLLSAQAALVSEADLPKLLKALDELGYTAKVE
jgi:hypothetical protein